MRYGICTGLEHLKLLESIGYDYIELSVAATMMLAPDVRNQYLKQLEESSIKCEVFNILFPKTMRLLDDHASDVELETYLHEAMTLVQSFGGQVVVFGSGKCRYCPDNLSYAEAYQRLVNVCRLTGEVADRYGIYVVIEPLSRSETNMICTMAEGAILAADVARSNVGLLSDYYHVMANRDCIRDVETIRHFGHIHIASAHGRNYPLSEDGEVYEIFMKALKKAGYDGRISIEGKTNDTKRDAVKALAFLKKLEERCYE